MQFIEDVETNSHEQQDRRIDRLEARLAVVERIIAAEEARRNRAIRKDDYEYR